MLSPLDVDKAIRPDNVSPHILKHCSNELCLPVFILFCHICRSGQFPVSWKLTPKKGSATDSHFYCLIAVPPTLAMVFERVIYPQIYHHISPYIPVSQFEFMACTGAQDCGIAMAFTAIQTLELHQECHIVSLDICGAFDSVWWAGLLKPLWSIGLRSKAYSLLCSYSCDRRLFVVVHDDTLLSRTLRLGFLRVEFGPPYCLIYTFVIFLSKYLIVVCFNMLMTLPL